MAQHRITRALQGQLHLLDFGNAWEAAGLSFSSAMPSLCCPCRARPLPPHSPQDDYRFGLLWVWNLYESMLYSPYVASRLQTYTGAQAAGVGGSGQSLRRDQAACAVELAAWRVLPDACCACGHAASQLMPLPHVSFACPSPHRPCREGPQHAGAAAGQAGHPAGGGAAQLCGGGM